MIRERGLTTDPGNQNGISRDKNRIRNTRSPDKVFYYHLNAIPTIYIRYGRRLITYSGNQNYISHNENRASNTKTTNKGLSPRSKITSTANIRYLRIPGTQYPFGKPLYNSAG